MKSPLISRRSLFGGVAAAAVAAVLPAREGQTFMLRAAGANTGPPMLHIGDQAIKLSAMDLRPGNLIFDGDGFIRFEDFIPAEPVLNRPGRTAADDYIDFGQSFETIDGERIPPEDWPEDFYDRDKLEEHWAELKDWKPT